MADADKDLIEQAIHLGLLTPPLTKDTRAFLQNFLAKADPAGRAIDDFTAPDGTRRVTKSQQRRLAVDMKEKLAELKERFKK